jgi:hypothetical protein
MAASVTKDNVVDHKFVILFRKIKLKKLRKISKMTENQRSIFYTTNGLKEHLQIILNSRRLLSILD